jgi:hypothetical protein
LGSHVGLALTPRCADEPSSAPADINHQHAWGATTDASWAPHQLLEQLVGTVCYTCRLLRCVVWDKQDLLFVMLGLSDQLMSIRCLVD